MAGNEPRKRYGVTLLAVAALVTVAYTATRREPETQDVPPEAAGWYGAMELYRNLALWAGKRALQAEMRYWKAVG
jgi:hypothetical protein